MSLKEQLAEYRAAWYQRVPAERQAIMQRPTYVIDRDGVIVYAYTDVDYRDRADPRDGLQVLKKKSIAA